MERLDEDRPRADLPFSETLMWAMFMTPYLHQEDLPENLPELREALPGIARQALGTIDFPRQRQEEVTQILSLAEVTRPYLARQQTPPPA